MSKVLRLRCISVLLVLLYWPVNSMAVCMDLLLIEREDDFYFYMVNDDNVAREVYASMELTLCDGGYGTNFCFEIKDEAGESYSVIHLIRVGSRFDEMTVIEPNHMYGRTMSKGEVIFSGGLKPGDYFLRFKYDGPKYIGNKRNENICDKVSNIISFSVK